MPAKKRKPAAREKRPPVLYAKTQRVIADLQRETKSAFISYWTSADGSIARSDVNGFYDLLRRLGPQDEIGLMIKSDGGSGRASLRIVHLLRQYAKRIIAYLPLDCGSAATMLALGADEIRMGPIAYLTPIDTSITHDLSPLDQEKELVSVSQDELVRVINLWRREAKLLGRSAKQDNPYAALFSQVHPLVVGAVDRASSLSVKLCSEILRSHLPDRKKADRISVHLNSAYPSHGYPIVLPEARRMGLRVRALPPKINQLLLGLNELYSEMGQSALTVFDQENQRNNEIQKIIETNGVQLYYQLQKDWLYRREEGRWVSLNDRSSWRRIARQGKKLLKEPFFVA